MKAGKTMAASVTALAGAALLAVGFTTAPLPQQDPAAPTADTVTAAQTYTLRAWNGRLAVFRTGKESPDTVYDEVAVAALPPQEQEKLQKGIEVPSRAALDKLLEDYTS